MAKEIKSNLQNIPATAHDVGKAVGWGRMPNSFCGLSFGHSHHGTQSMLLKKLSDVVKETQAKNVKEIESNLQNKHAAAY